MRIISNWQKVSATRRGLHTISAHTSNLYCAVMQCARASARHNQLLTHAGPGPLGVSGESAHRGYTGSAHRCRRFYNTNLLKSYDLPDTFKAPTLMALTRSTEGFSAPLASLYTVFFGGISIIRLSSYRHKALAFPLG